MAAETTMRPGAAREVHELREDELDAGVVPRFASVVAEQPHAVAVADACEQVDYAELARRAARVLSAVRSGMDGLVPATQRRGPAEFHAAEPVAMLFGHDVGTVAALLGIIASGHPVLVLDARTPAPRLRRLVEAAQVRLVVTDTAHEDDARALAERVVVPERDVPQPAAETLWECPPDPASVAVLAFTSGSTGTPKPVANDHRLLMQDAWNSSIASGCYTADDTIAHTLPIAFHAGLTTTVHGLVVGACMRLYDARTRGIAGLAPFIHDNGCTVMIASPAILRGFCDAGPDPAHLEGLRTLTIAGEAAYARDVEAISRYVSSRCVLRNRYGSSETGLIAEYIINTAHLDLSGPLPVGRGVGWTRLDVVDEDGYSAEVGRTGRLVVAARHVATGYWGMPDATAAAFTDNGDGTHTYRTSDLGRRLPDGSVEIVGRADHSVKVRGYLVDPGEVDAALFALPFVREAVTVGVPRETDEGNRLVAYVVPAHAGVDAAAIRGELRSQLPAHMVPEGIVLLDALPRTERGKLDRAALPTAPPVVHVGEAETLSHWQELVAVLWAKVLGVDTVRLDDDFFALGGDSLEAEELMSRIVDELGVDPEVASSRLLAEAPVLREFAARLQAGHGIGGRSLATLSDSGDGIPLVLVAGGGGLGLAFVPLARRLGTDRPVHVLQSPVVEGRGLPQYSVRQMARRHLAALREVQPHGPYLLAGHSFGGLLALEMAHQLVQAGEDVPLLTFLDSFPPDSRFHPDQPRLTRLQRVKGELGLLRACLRNTSGGTEAWRLFDQAGRLGKDYAGPPWPGRALVVVADSAEAELRGAWEDSLTGDWARIDAAGDHASMLRTPAVDELAHALRPAFRATDEWYRDPASGPVPPLGRRA